MRVWHKQVVSDGAASMTAYNAGCWRFLLTALAVVVCYLWIDRPLALLVHAYGSHRATFARLTQIPEPLDPLAVAAFAAFGLWVLAGRALPKAASRRRFVQHQPDRGRNHQNLLKFVFGRLWPDTWVANNPSFIHDGAYGFYFFHGGRGYASFPSGHTAVTCAVISVLWISILGCGRFIRLSFWRSPLA